jgi:predicted oxidoreductase
MSFQYSKHSLEQIKLRELDQDIIDDLLDRPDQIIKRDKHSVFFQKLVREGNKHYLYRVLVNTEKQPQMVITAYKTSKIEKYENQV